MVNKIKLSVIATTLTFTTALSAESARDIQTEFNKCLDKGALNSVTKLEDIFNQGRVCGQVRLGHISFDKATNVNNQSATAIGGRLKFSTASFNGISLGVAVFASQNISTLSGDSQSNKFAEDLSSSEKKYTEIAQAYINYEADRFQFRAGRQIIDTPLADSDDIRMTPHTFEAYIASYELENLGVTITAGNLQKWQGVDAGYVNVTTNTWAETGEDGTWMGAAEFANDTIAASVWYYDISKSQTDSVANSSVYTDIAYTTELSTDMALTLGAQYLTQSESDNSGIDGNIAGVIAEVSVNSLTLGLAYNRVSTKAGKSIFEGFGGGSSYTNMDTNTAGLFADGTYGDAKSYVLGALYEINDFSFVAAYGDFKADKYTAGANMQGHATEIDLGIEYAYNNGQIEAALYYIIGEDKASATPTDRDDDHVQLTVNYNF